MTGKRNSLYVASSHWRGRGRRRGSAPLEFVLVLVPMMFLFVALFWMGSVGINQANAVVDARYDAWGQRDAQRANPFEMQDVEQGLISASTERRISVSLLVDDWVTPRSSHAVYAGTWQDPHVDLNRSPNRDLYETLIEKGAKERLADLNGLVGDLGELPEKMGQAMAEELNPVEGLLEGMLDRLQRRGDHAEADVQSRREESEQKAEASIRADREEVRARIQKEAQSLEEDRKTVDEKRMEAKRLELALEDEKDKDDPDEDQVERLKKKVERLKDESDELEKTFPDREAGIERLKDADGNFQKSLEQLNGN